MAADPLRRAVSRLIDDGVIVPVSISCVRGVHARGSPRTPGGADLPCASAEAAGGVKRSPSGPSAASCEAGLLTPANVRELPAGVTYEAGFRVRRTGLLWSRASTGG